MNGGTGAVVQRERAAVTVMALSGWAGLVDADGLDAGRNTVSPKARPITNTTALVEIFTDMVALLYRLHYLRRVPLALGQAAGLVRGSAAAPSYSSSRCAA